MSEEHPYSEEITNSIPNYTRVSLSRDVVDRPDDQLSDCELLQKVIDSVPEGLVRAALLNQKGYRFRVFRRRTSNQPTEVIDGEIVPESTYTKALMNIVAIGIESQSPWSSSFIKPGGIIEWYFLPRKEDIEDGIDISMMLIYRDENVSPKQGLFGVLEVRWI